MSTIAPLRVAGDQTFEVRRLDILTWNLEGLPKLQRLIVDITLVLESTCDKLEAVDLALPFHVRDRDHDAEVLKADSLVLDPLSLPEAVSIDPRSNAVTYPGIGEVAARLIALQGETQGRNPRRWLVTDRMSRRKAAWCVDRLKFTDPLHRGDRTLVRLRYNVYGATGLVLWKRSGLGINGAFFEVRTGAGTLHRKDNLTDRLKQMAVKCDAVTITFVLRASFQLRLGAPRVEPTAIDGRSWESYLGRWTDLRRQGSLVAYSLRTPTALPDSEARLFLDVSREFGLMPLGNFLRIALISLVMIALCNWLGLVKGGRYRGIPWSSVEHAVLKIKVLYGAVGITSVGLLSRLRRVEGFIGKALNYWHRTDRWVWAALWKLNS